MNLYFRLLSYLKPYWREVTVSLLSMVVLVILNLVPPWFVKIVIDEVITKHDWKKLQLLVILLLAVYALRGVLTFAQTYLMHLVGQKVVYDLRTELYSHVQKLSLSFFKGTRTGEVMSRTVNDVDAIEDMTAHTASSIMIQGFTFIGIATVMIIFDWKLALITMIPVPILGLVTYRFNTRVRKIYRKVRERLADINARLQDNISGIAVIQSFVRESDEEKRFNRHCQDYLETNVSGIKMWARFNPVVDFTVGLGSILIIWYGGGKVMRGTLTVGTLVAFMNYLWRFYMPITELSRITDRIQRGLAAGQRICEFLDLEPEIKDTPGAGDLPAVKGEIEFDDVYFNYNSDGNVLCGVSLKIYPGEIVALVGPSGVGKTTLASLVQRFYDPTSGKVKLDGHDLRALKLAFLRSNIGLVNQDTFLFNGTIRENISYGKLTASDDEIIEAAESAKIWDFIKSLPNCLETEIGERGVKLSGGQKQRVSIARALLKDPPILILDEATSSVDTETELAIQESLGQLVQGRTTLIIAHRLATVKFADRIVVLDGGEIVESGSHYDLIQKGGLYSRLYEAQFGSQSVFAQSLFSMQK